METLNPAQLMTYFNFPFITTYYQWWRRWSCLHVWNEKRFGSQLQI